MLAAGALSRRGTYLVWAVLLVLGGALMAARVGFWDDVSGLEPEDVAVFESWSDYIAANHAMPVEDSWQYPPGAAFLMLVPRPGGDFVESFVATMLAFYVVGAVLMAILARREGNDTGVWVWLLAMPLLFTLPVLRFDLVPTVFAIGALLAIHRRPALFGAIAGIGATIKVWPILVLFGEWDRRRLVVAGGAALATAAAVFGIAAIAFGDQGGFLSHQADRGLQVEAVAASPWQLRQVITGEEPHAVVRFGTNEIASGPADTVAGLLKWASIAVLVGAAVWWLLRRRAIGEGREDLEEATVSRDFVFAVVLWLVVSSRVLSPQFMIWLLGLAVVVLTAGATRLARPAWIVIGAVILTAGLYQSPANFVLRNLALLVAAVDAAVALALMLRSPQRAAVGTSSSSRQGASPSIG